MSTALPLRFFFCLSVTAGEKSGKEQKTAQGDVAVVRMYTLRCLFIVAARNSPGWYQLLFLVRGMAGGEDARVFIATGAGKTGGTEPERQET